MVNFPMNLISQISHLKDGQKEVGHKQVLPYAQQPTMMGSLEKHLTLQYRWQH